MRKEIEFINKRHMFFMVSGIGILLSIGIIIARGGLNLGLDFVGGTLVQVKLTPAISADGLRNTLDKGGVKQFEVQDIISAEKDKSEYIIRVKAGEQKKEEMESQISTALSTDGLTFEVLRVEYVGATIGRHLANQAMYAIIMSLLGIIVYVGIRFKSSAWGVMGVAALFHDVVLTLGFLTLLNKEISLTVIAALLTLVGYSINDTIVEFDRIRENLYLWRKEPLDRIMNKSINQMLSRTILTSLTVFIAVLSLYVFGNEVIKDFAISLVFGVIVGTYSSIYIASALVLEWKNLGKKQPPAVQQPAQPAAAK